MGDQPQSGDESSKSNTPDRYPSSPSPDSSTIKNEIEDSSNDEQALSRGGASTQTDHILPDLQVKKEEYEEAPIDSNTGNNWLGYQTDESSKSNTPERSPSSPSLDSLMIKNEIEDSSSNEQAVSRGDASTQTDHILPDLQVKEEYEEVPIDSNAGNNWLGYQTGIVPDDEDLPQKAYHPPPVLPSQNNWETDEYGQSTDTPKQFICTECGKGFSLYSYLTKHQRSHSGEKPYSCTLCGKCFAYKPSLVTHQRVHTGEKPFSCTECGKLFVSKFNLKAHEKVHTGEKPVECPACGRCFSNNPALVKHLRIHTGEKPFTCTECGKVFASRSCLNAHLVLHTGERPYVCGECGKAFANQSNLISHRIIHTGQKPYVCTVCGRGFANQSNLAKHKLTHTDDKPFVCIECGNVFSRKDGLSKHYERIHKKKLEF